MGLSVLGWKHENGLQRFDLFSRLAIIVRRRSQFERTSGSELNANTSESPTCYSARMKWIRGPGCSIGGDWCADEIVCRNESDRIKLRFRSSSVAFFSLHLSSGASVWIQVCSWSYVIVDWGQNVTLFFFFWNTVSDRDHPFSSL